MCDKAKDCGEIRKLEEERKSAITRYWSVISGLVALLITIVVFYANTTNAMEQVRDHEQRLRILEHTAASSEALLNRISERIMSIDNKLDKHIEYRANQK